MQIKQERDYKDEGIGLEGYRMRYGVRTREEWVKMISRGKKSGGMKCVSEGNSLYVA